MISEGKYQQTDAPNLNEFGASVCLYAILVQFGLGNSFVERLELSNEFKHLRLWMCRGDGYIIKKLIGRGVKNKL